MKSEFGIVLSNGNEFRFTLLSKKGEWLHLRPFRLHSYTFYSHKRKHVFMNVGFIFLCGYATYICAAYFLYNCMAVWL